MHRIPAKVLRRTARLGVAAALLMTPLLAAAPAAAASVAAAGPDCAAPIVDSAHALAGGAATTAALARFSGLRIQLRVRTYSSLPRKDPDAQERRLEQQCAAWRSEDGTRRPDLVSVIVDTGDRRTGLFFGSDWDSQLQANFSSIESDDMNPEFQNGRFDAGIAAGLDSVFNDVSDNQVPADPTLDESGLGGGGGGDATAALPIGDSSDPGAAFFGVGVVLVVLVFIGGLATTAFRGSRRRGRGSQPFDPDNAGLNGSVGFFGEPGSTHHHHTGGGFSGGGMGGGGGGFSGGGGGGGGGGGSSSW